MAIVITQTCDACGGSRELDSLKNHDHGGWRVLDRRIVCVDCIKALFNEL